MMPLLRVTVAPLVSTALMPTASREDTQLTILPVFRTLIRMSPPVPRSIAARESILTFSPHCGASKDYRAFVREYLEGRAAS